MINQILFLFGLYAFGVFFGLLFKRGFPPALIGITGFLWGALFWVVGGILMSTISIPYTPVSMLILFILLVIGFGIIHIKNKTWGLSRRELACLLPIALVFLLVLILASQFNFSYVSSDSIVQISTGRRIAYEGFSSGVIEEFSLRGVFLPQLQSASVFLGDGYLYAAQPAFGLSFALIFYFLSHRIISLLLPDKRLALALTILTSLALFSTYFIAFQFFYIHNSMISAVYLFMGVSAFWLAAVEEKGSWMTFGILGLLGFSLARNEAPIFALIFLVLAISADRIPYRIRLRSILTYLALLVLWYLYLLWRMGGGTKILNPEKTLVIVGVLVAFALLVIFSESKWVKRFVLPHLPKIMLGSLALILVLMVSQKQDHMVGSLYVSILNMLQFGRWGVTWLVFSLLFLVSIPGPRVPREELFLYGISSFFGLLMLIVYFRNPYRIGWYDSANRMLTHILPIIVLYILMKAAQGLSKESILSGPGNRD